MESPSGNDPYIPNYLTTSEESPPAQLSVKIAPDFSLNPGPFEIHSENVAPSKGTMVQVNFVYANTGGLVDLYLDGTIWMSVDTYAAEDVTSCDQYLVANSTLPDGSHTLAVINADPSSRTHLTGFVYSSSSTSTSGNPTSTSSQSSSPKTSKSLTPIIVSAVGGLVVLIVFIAIVIWLVRRSSRASQSTPETHDTKHASLAMYDDRTSKYQAVSLRNYSISHSPISPPASSPGFGEISTSDYPPQSPISEQSPRTSLLTSNQRQQERSSVGMDSFGHRGSTGFAQEQTQPATQNTWTPEKWNPNRIAEDVGPSSSAGGGGGGGGPVGWGPPPAYGDERGGNRR
ncbi:hypothetical protein FRB98_007262 [Tulasnella sp. 332]|nr:hypothetical protein FRB98_007262 [Tulasnella sp. 332]